jgi:uncharacterized membrane protein
MLTYTPFEKTTDTLSKVNMLEGRMGPVNVGHAERYGSIIGGAALAVMGLSRRSLPGLLLAGMGGLFVMRGLAGHCKVYEALGKSTAGNLHFGRKGVRGSSGIRVERSLLIARPPDELYRFWRNLENLPEFMDNIESVRVLDDKRSHWVVKGPGGQRVEWDAEIVTEHPGEMISWQTLPGADVESAGSVRFIPAMEGQGTTLRVVLEFRPPGGMLGAHVAKFFGKDPGAELDQDLGRLKEIIEQHDVSAAARVWE